MEGYVDARRVASRGCVLLASPRPPPPGELELAASGPTRLWAGGSPVVAVGGEPGAVLGEGVRLRAGATAGPLTVLTCPDRRGRAGFYLLRR